MDWSKKKELHLIMKKLVGGPIIIIMEKEKVLGYIKKEQSMGNGIIGIKVELKKKQGSIIMG